MNATTKTTSGTSHSAGKRHGSATVALPSDTEILITRHFDAPAALVWEAMTQPEHVLRWWGPDWCPLMSAEIDLRVGGTWRYVARMDDGSDLGWHGVYRAIDPPHSLTSTEVFEGYADAESVNTMTLTEHDGVTRLQTLVRHSSKEHRDGHIQSGMEDGMQQTFNRLDGLLELLDGGGAEAERFRRVAAHFDAVVAAVPADAWTRTAFCDGWTAIDPVKHLAEWVPSLFSRAGLDVAPQTPADVDPVAAWGQVRAALQAALDDPVVAASEIDIEPIGTHTVAAAIEKFVTGDVIVHVWDVATAARIDLELEQMIDADIAAPMVEAYASIGDMLVASGHYKRAVPLPDDATIQAKLIAATGRDPYWKG